MKRLLAILLITIFMFSAAGTALAHGHGRGGRHHSRSSVSRQPRYAVCTVEGCEEAGPHQHDGSWYCCPAGSGNDYTVCTVKGCTEVGLHKHDGTYYHCQHHGTGRGCGGSRNR